MGSCYRNRPAAGPSVEPYADWLSPDDLRRSDPTAVATTPSLVGSDADHDPWIRP
jgi:hypothetical protein